MMIDTIELYILILVQLTFTLIQDHRSARKLKLQWQLSPKVFDRFGWNLIYCWDLLVWWTSYSFYLVHSVVKGKNPTCLILWKNTWTLACIQTFNTPISFKLGMMIGTTKLCILISVRMTLTFIQAYSYMRNQKLWCSFSHKFGSSFSHKFGRWFGRNWEWCHNLFVEAHAKLVLYSIQGKKLCWRNLVKYAINIVLCRNTCFKLGRMLDTTKLYS